MTLSILKVRGANVELVESSRVIGLGPALFKPVRESRLPSWSGLSEGWFAEAAPSAFL